MTKPRHLMTPRELEVNAARNAARRRTERTNRLTPQDHLEMVLLHDVGLWPDEAVAGAYGVSMKTLRNQCWKQPAAHIVWRGTP